MKKNIVPTNSSLSLVESFLAQRRSKFAQVEHIKVLIEQIKIQNDISHKPELQKLLHERIIRENELQKIEAQLLTSESVSR